MVNFAELMSQKNRSKAGDALKAKVESLKKKSYDDKEPDARVWDLKHLKNADGNGRATIRFLPAPMHISENESEPFVMWFSYFHKNKENNKWYVSKSLKTFGNDEKDPVYDYNGTIYGNSHLSDKEKQEQAIKRSKNYRSNILVVDDPKEPSNNGKVFLFEYGPMFYKMIEACMSPDPEVTDDEPANPFDPIEGRDLKIKIVSKLVNGTLTPNYETSTWGPQKPYAETEEEMEAIWKKTYPLQPFLDRTTFETYEKQLANFKRVFGFEPIAGEETKTEATKEPKKLKTKEETKAALNDSIPGDDDGEPPFDLDDVQNVVNEDSNEDDDADDFFSKFRS